MLLLLLLSASSALANAALLEQGENVIIGPQMGNGFYGLSVLDTNHFNQGDKYMGLYRYGYGHAGISLGNGIGIRMASSSGWRWLGGLKEQEGLAPLVALEGGGHLEYNTNALIHSYYQWQPGVAVGVQANIAGWHSTLMLQAGPTLGNYSSPNMLPYIEPRVGAGLYTHVGPISIGGTLSLIGPHSDLSVDVLALIGRTYIGARYEHAEGGTAYPYANTFFLLVTQPVW